MWVAWAVSGTILTRTLEDVVCHGSCCLFRRRLGAKIFSRFVLRLYFVVMIFNEPAFATCFAG